MLNDWRRNRILLTFIRIINYCLNTVMSITKFNGFHNFRLFFRCIYFCVSRCNYWYFERHLLWYFCFNFNLLDFDFFCYFILLHFSLCLKILKLFYISLRLYSTSWSNLYFKFATLIKKVFLLNARLSVVINVRSRSLVISVLQ